MYFYLALGPALLSLVDFHHIMVLSAPRLDVYLLITVENTRRKALLSTNTVEFRVFGRSVIQVVVVDEMRTVLYV